MKNKLKLIVAGAVAGFCNGLFGSGGGCVVVPFLEKYASLEPKKSHATAILVVLPLCIASIFKYRTGIQTDMKILIYVCVSGALGSVFGALFLKKLSSKTLKRVFAVFIMAAAVKAVCS